MDNTITGLRLAVAAGVGLLISTLLLVLEALTDHALTSLRLQMPGINAADFFRVVVGGSALAGVAMSWLVNAIVYGTGAFMGLAVLGLLRQDAKP